jgi:FRG domain
MTSRLNEHSCPERRVHGWRDFLTFATECMEAPTRFAYRGEARSDWVLRPSLVRLNPAAGAKALLKLERDAVEEFASQAHLYLASDLLPTPDVPVTYWWVLMQHYGAPTRLIDWTLSPFVAAYFAVEQARQDDGVVLVVNADAVQARVDDRHARVGAGLEQAWATMFNYNAPHEAFFWKPLRRSARSAAQQAFVSLSENVAASHGALFDIATKYAVQATVPPAARWLFPASIKDEILDRLRAANIAAHSLFPGPDGLGRSVAEVARIGSSQVVGASLSATSLISISPTASLSASSKPENGGNASM